MAIVIVSSGGAAGAHGAYVTRVSSLTAPEPEIEPEIKARTNERTAKDHTNDEELAQARIILHNLEHLRGEDYVETRELTLGWLQLREDQERERPRRGPAPKGDPKLHDTHYRVVLSIPGKASTREMREAVEHLLDECMPTARAIAVIHQDTQHTHAHVILDKETIDRKRIRIDKKKLAEIKDVWREKVREMELVQPKNTIDRNNRGTNNRDSRTPIETLSALGELRRAAATTSGADRAIVRARETASGADRAIARARAATRAGVREIEAATALLERADRALQERAREAGRVRVRERERGGPVR
jgi:hypothetical protein